MACHLRGAGLPGRVAARATYSSSNVTTFPAKRVYPVVVLRCHKAKPFTQVEGLPVIAGATFSVRGYGSLPGEGKEHVIDDLGHEPAGHRPTPKAQFAVEDIDR
jgi:hypothetical protein